VAAKDLKPYDTVQFYAHAADKERVDTKDFAIKIVENNAREDFSEISVNTNCN